jgi:Uncharacterized protein conserved in bacteria
MEQVGSLLICCLYDVVRIGDAMDFQVGDVIKVKKAHPCGTNQWEITRVGMDFRLKCKGCGRQVMLPRKQVEKSFRGKYPAD